MEYDKNNQEDVLLYLYRPKNTFPGLKNVRFGIKNLKRKFLWQPIVIKCKI